MYSDCYLTRKNDKKFTTMELIRSFLAGQKEFVTDFLVIFNVCVLSIAYFFGVGIAFLMFKKKDNKSSKDSTWVDADSSDKDNNYFLKQF